MLPPGKLTSLGHPINGPSQLLTQHISRIDTLPSTLPSPPMNTTFKSRLLNTTLPHPGDKNSQYWGVCMCVFVRACMRARVCVCCAQLWDFTFTPVEVYLVRSHPLFQYLWIFIQSFS